MKRVPPRRGATFRGGGPRFVVAAKTGGRDEARPSADGPDATKRVPPRRGATFRGGGPRFVVAANSAGRDEARPSADGPDATKRVPPRRGATFRGGTAGAIGIVSVQPIMLLVQPGKDRPRELTVCPRSHIRRSSEATLWDESLNVKARVGVGRATFRAAA